jgi:Uma2 family endonuclease
MQAEVTKKLFTADEYYRMSEAGILTENDRVELIEGEIIEMSPIGNRHAACVDRATELFISALQGKAIVSVQSPVRLNEYNEPQPDIVVLRRRGDYYESQRRTAEDTLMLIEVSDSLHYDVKVKLPIYARTGIPEVWIENLTEDILLICRNPVGNRYIQNSSCIAVKLPLRWPFPASPLLLNSSWAD